MSIDLQQAFARLEELTAGGTSIASAEDLRNLAMDVSVYSEGNITVLYGDKLPDGTETSDIANSIRADPNLRMLNKTAASAFLGSLAFRQAVADTFGVDNLDKLRNPPSNEPDAIAANRFRQ